jgi:DNA-directed RNA polymerase specialized sigma24 family protein
MKFVVKPKSSPVPIEGLLLGAFPALRAFFRHRLPAERRGEAEDFAQETLLAAWQALMSRGP